MKTFKSKLVSIGVGLGLCLSARAGVVAMLQPSTNAWDYATTPLTNYFAIPGYTNTAGTNSSGASIPAVQLSTEFSRANALQISMDYCATNAAGQSYVARFSASDDNARFMTNYFVWLVTAPQGTNNICWVTNFDSSGMLTYVLTSFESTNANSVAGFLTNGSFYPGLTNGVGIVNYTNLTVKGNAKTGM